MRLQSAPKLLEISLALGQQLMRVRKGDFAKTHLIAGAKLRRDWKIDRDHVRDFWITPDRLAISEQENRLPARRNLNGPRRNRFRNKIDIVISF